MAPSNISLMSVTAETSQPEMSWLKASVLANMEFMSVTFETFQPEILPLNVVWWNM